MEGADGDPGRTLREGSAQSQSRLSSWDHNIMFELWFQRTAPDRRGRACRAAAGGRAGTLRGSAGSSPVWRSQRHRKGQRRSGGCLRTLRHIFLNAELQTSIYDGYSCSVGSPLTDPQRQILRINRAREKKQKTPSVINRWRKWRCMEQTDAAFTCSDTSFLWRQQDGKLKPPTHACTKSAVRNLYLLSPYPSIS